MAPDESVLQRISDEIELEVFLGHPIRKYHGEHKRGSVNDCPMQISGPVIETVSVDFETEQISIEPVSSDRKG